MARPCWSPSTKSAREIRAYSACTAPRKLSAKLIDKISDEDYGSGHGDEVETAAEEGAAGDGARDRQERSAAAGDRCGRAPREGPEAAERAARGAARSGSQASVARHAAGGG